MTESVEIDAKQNQVEYGDIFFTTSSETPEEVGMSSVWLGNEANVYLNSFCFGYRPVTELAPYYMAFMLRSPNVRKNSYFLHKVFHDTTFQKQSHGYRNTSAKY